jgi:drug/metabolite transporter (DMT)-like permease
VGLTNLDAWPIGELAALTTAFCWAFASVMFANVGRKVGAHVVNRTRILFAFVFLAIFHLAVEGTLFPTDATPTQWMWLGISSILGLVIGDTLVYTAYILIGPRLSTLLMATVPITGSILGYLLFNEILKPLEVVGILCGVIGVCVVVNDGREAHGEAADPRRFWIGVLCGAGGAMCQVVHLITARLAIQDGLSTVSATLIRTAIALVLLWVIALHRGQWLSTLKSWDIKTVFTPLLIGSLIGPALGIWLSIVAVKMTHVGIASTLMALPPILLIPYDKYYLKNPVSAKSIAATFLALTGVGLILNA